MPGILRRGGPAALPWPRVRGRRPLPAWSIIGGMFRVHPCELPAGALLLRHRGGPSYTDGWFTDVAGVVSHTAFVEAFYTTPLFKLERWLLGVVASRPSTDAGARALARSEADRFAAWHVEARGDAQLLLAAGRTRSWLMVGPAPGAAPAAQATRLYFGSAVIAHAPSPGAEPRLGLAFHLLLGFHRLYSQALLAAARARCAAASSLRSVR